MSMTAAAPAGRNRYAALLVLALMIVVPAVWIGWSLNAAAAAAETIRVQSALLAGLRERMATLQLGPASTGAVIDVASIYLPGETASIAGATLQRTIADTIGAAGGRVVESEFSQLQIAENPGQVDLRVAFDAEIVGLQQILFQLETGLPIFFLRSLDVRSAGTTEVAADQSPPLRVIMLVEGHRQVEE